MVTLDPGATRTLIPPRTAAAISRAPSPGGASLRSNSPPTSSIPVQLTADAFFYVQGRAEVALLFVGAGEPFPNDTANQVIKKVMGRAKAISPSA